MRVRFTTPLIHKGHGPLDSLVVNKIKDGVAIVRGKYLEGKRKAAYCILPPVNPFKVRRFAIKAECFVDPDPPFPPPFEQYLHAGHLLIRPYTPGEPHAAGYWICDDDQTGPHEFPITEDQNGWYLGWTTPPEASIINVFARIEAPGAMPVEISCSFSGPPPGHKCDRAF